MFAQPVIQAFLLLLTTTLAAPTPTSPLDGSPAIQPRVVINTPSPMLGPLHPKCMQFHMVTPGDTCASIAASKAIKLKDFYKSNPVLGANGEHCGDKLLQNHFYCVKAKPIGGGGGAAGAMSRPGVNHASAPANKKKPAVDWGSWNLMKNILGASGQAEVKKKVSEPINLWDQHRPKPKCKAAEWLGWCP